MTRSVFFVLLGLLVLPEWSHAATACVDVQAPVESPVQYASRCFGIIGYKVQVNTVPAAWPLTCTKDMEDFLGALDSIAGFTSTQCHQALTAFACRSAMPPCGYAATADLLPSHRICQNAQQMCTAQELGLVNAFASSQSLRLPFNATANGFSVGDGSCVATSAYSNATFDSVQLLAAARRPLCEPYTGSVCRGAISGNVYVPQYAAALVNSQLQTTQAAVEAQLTSAGVVFNALGAPTLPSSCRINFIKTACAAAFQSCSSLPLGGGINVIVPSPPDYSLCTATHATCPPAYVNAATSPVAAALGFDNCTSLLAINGGSNILPVGGGTCVLPTKTIRRFPENNYQPVAGHIINTTTLPHFTSAVAAAAQGTRSCLNESAAPQQQVVSPSQFASRCYGFLNYSVGINSGPPNTNPYWPLMCTRDMEDFLGVLDASAGFLSSGCHQALTAYTCRSVFPPCNWAAPNDLVPSTRVCNHVTSMCTSLELTKINILFASNQLKLPALPMTLAGRDGFDLTVSNAAGGACLDSTLYSPGVPDGVNLLAVARKPLCEPYTGSVCKGVVNYNVYVPQYFSFPTPNGPVTSQAVVEAQLQPGAFLFNLVPQPTCRLNYIKLMCAAAFSPCQVLNIQTGLPAPVDVLTVYAPQLPDRSLCTATHAAVSAGGCPTAFTGAANPLANGLNAFNCSAQLAGNAGSYIDRIKAGDTGFCGLGGGAQEYGFFDRFPINQYSASGNTVNTTKMEFVTNSEVVSMLPACPEPSVKTEDPARGLSGGSCALPCPSLLFTKEQYDTSDELFLFFSTCGLALSSLLLFTYLAFAKARRRIYTIYFTCNIWIVSLFLVFASAGEGDSEVPGIYAKYRCLDRSHPAKRGLCLWVSLVMLFTGSSAVAWWFVQAADLYLQVAWGSRRWSPEKSRAKEIVYYCWGFGYPLICLLIVTGEDVMGNGMVGIPWCFFDESDLGNDLGWGLFYGPIAVQAVLGAFFMGFIIKQLWSTSVQMKSHKKKGWWKLYIKPLLFVFVFEVVWTIVFAFRFVSYFAEDDLRADAATLLKCVLQDRPTALAGGASSYACDVRPQPNVGLWIAVQIAIGGVGMWSFALYYNRENFVMWYHWLTCKPYNFSRTSGSTSGTSTGSKGSRGVGSRQGSKRVLFKGGPKRNKPARTTTGTSTASSFKYVSGPTMSPAASSMELDQMGSSTTDLTASAPPSELPPVPPMPSVPSVPSDTADDAKPTTPDQLPPRPRHKSTPSGLPLDVQLPTNLEVTYGDPDVDDPSLN